MIRPRLLLVFAILLFCLGTAVPVSAHAMLVRSVPDANAALASSPPRVELYFSETVALAVSNVKVLNASGKQVDQADQQLDPLNAAHLLVSLPPLPQGVYLVVWRAISATDGHQTTGSFPFSIGNVLPGAMTALGSQAAVPAASDPLAAVLAKGFLYLAVATLLGGSLFTFLVWNSCMARDRPGG